MSTQTKPKINLFGKVQQPSSAGTLTNPVQSKTLTVPSFRLRETPGEQLVMFGNERQRLFGEQLDEILVEVTKGSNPVLFELFNKLSKGVNDVNIPELEQEIIKASKNGPFGRFLESVGLSSASKRLQKANERVGQMLQSKSTSLLDICKDMQDATQKEVVKLIDDSQRMQSLARGLTDNVSVFQEYALVGRKVLEEAREEYAGVELAARSSNDSAQINEAKQFEDKIRLFESRLVVLETILQKAPTDLEAIRIGLNASLSTLGETANSALEDFNDIKSILVKLSLSHQIATVQGLNEERRKLKAGLQTHANQQLANVAVTAARASGINRLEDTELLLKSAKDLADINVKIKQECTENDKRLANARVKLLEIKTIIDK